MTTTKEKMTFNIIYGFFIVFPFLIYPWGSQYYYANAKAYYFIGMVFVLIILGWFNREHGKGLFKSIRWVEWLLLLFLLLIGCSTFYSIKLSLVGNSTEHQGLVMMIAYGLLFVMARRWFPYFQQEKLLHGIIITSNIAAIYGILQHDHIGFLPQDRATHFFNGRSYSFFDNPDYYGAYLVLMIVVSMALFLLHRGRVKFIIYWLTLCILFVALLESATRSAWVGAGVGFLFLTLFVIRKRMGLWKRWGSLLLSFLIIFVVINISSHQTYAKRVVTIQHDAQKIVTQQNSDSAGASRWYIWRVSLPLIEDHPWLGTGPNTFTQVFNPKNKLYLHGPIYDENNNYMQIALTMGIPALLIYILFLCSVIFSGFKQAGNVGSDQQILQYGLLAAIIGYMVQAVFNISVASVAPYFWLYLGLVSVTEMGRGTRGTRGTEGRLS